MSKSHKQPAHDPAPQPSAPVPALDRPVVDMFAGGPSGEQVMHVIKREEVSVVSGPIPSADELQKYEVAIPGSTVHIFEMARAEQQHRHKIESEALAAQIADQKASRTERGRGQFCALAIGFCAIAGAVLIAIYGNATGSAIVAGLIGAGGLGSLLMAFLVDHNKKQPPKASPGDAQQQQKSPVPAPAAK